MGVLGTLIWDRIYLPGPREGFVEGWGGISYSLEALAVSLPANWTVEPILKLGSDLADEALAYLDTIPKLGTGRSVSVSPGPNSRVELRYHDRARRTERISGDIPRWDLADLQPNLEGLDALYLNFITGREMSLESARGIRDCFGGPIYADLHTLFAGISPKGFRFLRELPDLDRWLKAFDAIQMNEDEFGLTAPAGTDPWNRAEGHLGSGLRLIVVTLGSRGSGYIAEPGFSANPLTWRSSTGPFKIVGGGLRGTVPTPKENDSGDPTGCGDVWGATFFGRLLGGDPLEAAMAFANRNAGAAVEHRGARGLHLHLGDRRDL